MEASRHRKETEKELQDRLDHLQNKNTGLSGKKIPFTTLRTRQDVNKFIYKH